MRFFAPIHRNLQPAVLGQRLIILRDLIALGQVRIKIVLARESRKRIDACSAWPARPESPSPPRGGSAPAARPEVPGIPDKRWYWAARRSPVAQPQKILVRVLSWTCTSSPITGSYFAISSGVATPKTPEAMLHYRNARAGYYPARHCPGLQLRASRQVNAEIGRVGCDVVVSQRDELDGTLHRVR